MTDIIPFVPFRLAKAKKMSERFRGLASKAAKSFPNLETELLQSRIDITPVEYISIALYSTAFWFIAINAIMIVSVAASGQIVKNLYLIPMVSLPVTGMSFLYLISFPMMTARFRAKLLDRDLLFALRHALIQVKSGVTLFDTIASIARGGYGTVSEEFNRVVRDINAGVPAADALERAGFENPSPPLRQVIWQLSNSLKAGSDIALTLDSLVAEFEKEQLNVIQKYGKEMNTWTMMYMMAGVIMPSLGITFIIVMSSFFGGSVSESVFYLILIFVIFFQIFFLSFMKTKRPMSISSD